jgi:hypothetical protein
MLRMGYSRLAFATALFALLFALSLGAAGQQATPKYDKSTEVTLKGIIEDVKIVPGTGEGTHVLLRTGDKLQLVHIAPEKFLKDIDLNLTKGAKIEVTGSKVKSPSGEDEVLARTVSLDANDNFTLRDPAGVPVWQGWR